MKEVGGAEPFSRSPAATSHRAAASIAFANKIGTARCSVLPNASRHAGGDDSCCAFSVRRTSQCVQNAASTGTLHARQSSPPSERCRTAATTAAAVPPSIVGRPPERRFRGRSLPGSGLPHLARRRWAFRATAGSGSNSCNTVSCLRTPLRASCWVTIARFARTADGKGCRRLPLCVIGANI